MMDYNTLWIVQNFGMPLKPVEGKTGSTDTVSINSGD